MDNRKQVLIRIEPELYEDCKLLASCENYGSLTKFIIALLDNEVAKKKPQLDNIRQVFDKSD